MRRQGRGGSRRLRVEAVGPRRGTCGEGVATGSWAEAGGGQGGGEASGANGGIFFIIL
jgi:hypothetical protein